MATVELLRVFLASPGDVAAERQIVKEVLDAVNRTVGLERGVRFEIVGWDTDSYPAYGKDPQAIVNDQIVDMARVDLFVGIMWNRFGSPTPRADSGTEEEFRQAVESFRKVGRPAIMFYFNRQPSSPATAREAEQKVKVLAFKEEIQKDGLTANYDGPEDFRRLFQLHVEKWLIQNGPTALTPPHVEPEPKVAPETHTAEPARAAAPTPAVKAAPESVSNSGMWVLLKSRFFLASEVNEPGGRRVTLKVPAQEAEEDAFFRSLQPSPYGRQELVPFAHQNTGAIAKVLEAKRSSSGDAAFWELSLELEETGGGFGSEIAYGGTSADELAEMRARYILLNEKPTRPGGARGRRVTLEDGLFEAFVQGITARVKVQGSVLPSLWKELKGDKEKFLPLARLWSVFHLITSNTCEHILELKLGPIRDGVMHVRFRGQRKRVYTNVEPYVIEFEGDSDLNAE